MISRSRSGPTAAAMSIECTTSANNTVTCLYSADAAGVCDWRAALVTELGVGRQFGAARPTEQPRRGQSTATIPAGVHVSIVSPLVNDVRHIAVPSPIRGFEPLICRLSRRRRPCRHAIRSLVAENTTGCDRCVDSQIGIQNPTVKGGHRYLLFKAKHSLLKKVCAGGHPAGGGETRRHPSCTISHCHCFSHLRAQALRRQFLCG